MIGGLAVAEGTGATAAVAGECALNAKAAPRMKGRAARRVFVNAGVGVNWEPCRASAPSRTIFMNWVIVVFLRYEKLPRCKDLSLHREGRPP